LSSCTPLVCLEERARERESARAREKGGGREGESTSALATDLRQSSCNPPVCQ
jgi:hypothetical protein